MILDKSKQKDIQLRGSVPIAEICLWMMIFVNFAENIKLVSYGLNIKIL